MRNRHRTAQEQAGGSKEQGTEQTQAGVNCRQEFRQTVRRLFCFDYKKRVAGPILPSRTGLQPVLL